ncbi:MAG: gliding motility-associated C-terminal domain-containing protein [Bacteroidetes bacterium]|nr:gliding motility-associated C-terminal domain-containing protein [Bacteroidota bacterium]
MLPVVTGPATVCANNQAQTYTTTTNQPPGVTYNWTVPPGASFSGSGTSINVNFSGASPGTAQVCVTVQNACGTSQPGCATVNITTPPATPTLSGPTTVCSSGGGINYSVSSPQGGVTYNWTAPVGATITGSGAMVSINFLNASSGQVCVAAQNSCGTSSPACQNVQVIPAPTATISGSGAICQGSGQTVNLTISLTGTGPWDVTYTNGGPPVTINITTSPHTLTVNQPGTYTLTGLTVAGSNCTGTVSGSAVVTQNPSPTATLSGSGSICQGSGQQVPLTINFTGTAQWTVDWTLDGAAQASFMAGTNPFTWNIGQGQAGNLALTDVLDGNGCDGTASGTATVTVITAPTVSGISADCDVLNVNFTVIFTINGGDPASYSVTPLNGTLSGNVFTSNPIPSGSGYSFVVNDANNCNPVTVADNAVICNCATAVGDMDLTPVEICGDGPQSVPYNSTGQNFDGNDVLVFYLHSGSGVAIVAPVHSISDTTLVSFIPATMNYGTTYYLSAVVGDSDGSGGVNLNDPCLAVAQGTPVTFYEIPTAVLSGNDAVCVGQTGSLTVDFTGEGPWSISYNDGSGNIQTINGITANPYTLSVTPTTTTTFCLTTMNDVNCTGNESGCGTVTVNTGVQVTNFVVACNATSTAYTITFNISGGDPASYFVSGVTGNIVAGVFTSNQIPTGTGYSLTVDDANNCDPQTFSQSVVICNCTTDAGQMDPATVTVCGDGPTTVPDSTGVVLDGDDITQYVLHTNSGSNLGTVIATNNFPTFAFDGSSMTYGTTYYVSLIAGNDDGTGNVDTNDPCFQVAAGTPVIFYEIPTASLSGATEICPGESADLTIGLTGDSPWAVTINGQQVTGIIGTPYTYTVTPSTTTVYNLTIVNDEHCADTISLSQTITVHTPPTITFVDAQCNATGTGFTVCIDIAGGDPSCYQVFPATGTLTGNQFCSDEMPDGQGYSFQISDCHGCPVVVASAPIVDCNCISQAGDMAGAPLSICGNTVVDATQFYQGGEIFDGDDVLCYMLHNGNGQPILTSTSGQFSYQAGTVSYGTTYFISAIVGNDDGNGCVDTGDPCFNVGAGIQVTFHAIPTATLTGNATICSGEATSLTLTLTGVAPWTVVYENASGNQLTVTAGSSPFPISVSPTSSNVYSLISVSDGYCVGTVSGNATVTVNTPPSVANVSELCDASGQTYQVSFNILGGDPASYTISPSGALVGGIFTSNPIPTGTAYSFSVDDANGCGPTIVSGLKVCDCNTDAGTMSLILLNICVDEMAITTPASDTLLDPNDVLVYILHTNNGSVLGTIIATNSTPTFSFIPGTMTTGTQYYISAVVGNNNGSGGVDLNDPCLDVAPGTPVIFRALPTISISGTTSICEGESTTLTLTVTGTGPFNVNYTANGVPQTLQIPTAGSFPMTVTPLATTTITLVSIEDVGAGCDNTSTQSVTVTVNPPVEAGTSLGDISFCQDAAQPVDLDDHLSGADPGGQWSGPLGAVPGGTVNTALLAPGIYPFTYLLNGISPCPDDQAIVTLTIHPTPVADAGQDQHLSCDETQVTLGGSGTTPGVNYSWTGGNVSDNTSANPTTTNPGTYTLLASNSFGCSDNDVVVVTQSVSTPVLHIAISDVSCFGQTDGFILVDSVTGGVAPYLFSVDGSAFTSTLSFTNLGPGQHTITVSDAGGCESSLTFSVAEPQEVTVEIEGNFTGNNPIIDLGDELVLTIISNPAVSLLDTIVWSVAGIDSCKTCPELIVMPVQQTTYSVRVEKDGCDASDNLTVFVEKNRPVYVPNVFSPNDDGINDLFTIYAGESVSEIKSFLVFNRWGESVYEYYNFIPNDPAVGWDGTHRDKYMQPAVFTWFAEIEFIDGSVEIYQGDVTLVR